MSEPKSPASAPVSPPDEGAKPSAGAMLRAAREAHGLELDQLALVLKVPVPKLEALEADRIDELPGLAFVRGLATAIARQFGVDPQPILAALPSPSQAPQALENVTRGLATPYREPNTRIMPASWPDWLRPSVIVPVLLLLLALLFWFAPPLRVMVNDAVPAVAPAASSAASASAVTSQVSAQAADGADSGGAVTSSAAISASAVVETVHSAPPDELAASQAAAAGSVVLRTSAESWIKVLDRADKVLLSRMLPAGEVVGLDGALPIKLTIGNASGTRVHFRGEPIDLSPYTRDNVARLELK